LKKLCVIGDPISHSLSPLIQNAMIRALGLPFEYSAVRVERGRTKEWLELARAKGYAGFNATMPHKEELAGLMDVLSPEAAACAAVNTVCIRNGRYYGFSTDGEGFFRSLADAEVSPAGKKVLLLGAGGAAKAVALRLAGAKAAEIAVCNRTEEKALELAKAAPEIIRAALFTPETLSREAADASLLVNCTSLGMEGTAGQFDDFSFLDGLPSGAAVCDIIYRPPETELLRRAKARGLRAANGLGMLIHQAICALEHFSDAPLDQRRMYEAASRALATGG
jgi:shikimate dehydrogenase